MIYGMYLSATGIITSAYRQDVIANNIANSEAIGFKKDLAIIQQRKMASDELPGGTQDSDPLYANLGGGMLTAPTLVDTEPGGFQQTGNPLDVAIDGQGYFGVNAKGQFRLTRDGQFFINQNGQLALSTKDGPTVVDVHQNPIVVKPGIPVTISRDGTVTQKDATVARLGVFDVADPTKLVKQGGTLMSYGGGDPTLDTKSTLRTQSLEGSNVDPATELTELMDAQRQLEANANMIRTQDETLSKLVSDVGKIS
jgi:flagellar basal body rod protein FlgG